MDAETSSSFIVLTLHKPFACFTAGAVPKPALTGSAAYRGTAGCMRGTIRRQDLPRTGGKRKVRVREAIPAASEVAHLEQVFVPLIDSVEPRNR